MMMEKQNIINEVFKSIDNFIGLKRIDFKNGKYDNFDSNNSADCTAFICAVLNHVDDRILPNTKITHGLNDEDIKQIYSDLSDIWLLDKNIYKIYKKYQVI